MIRWLRVVLPPWWAVILAGFLYTLFQSALLGLEWYFDLPLFGLMDTEKEVPALVMGQFAFGYAVYRVWAFHPALRPGYFQWLCGTPWSSVKPLPLGPLHLVWQDVILLALWAGLSWPRAGLQSLNVFQVFLFTYLSLLGLPHFVTGQKSWAYAVAFGVGVMALVARNPWLCFGAASVTYVAAFLGLRASLASFPWEGTPLFSRFQRRMQQELKSKESAGQNPGPNQGTLGWPFDHLGPPHLDLTGFDRRDRLLAGLLLGWWFYVFYSLARSADSDWYGAHVCYSIFLVLGIAFRVAIYCNGYLPPLSLLGRLGHGRPIIPGYDQVFIAPLLALAVGAAVPLVPWATGLDPLIAVPSAVVLTTWILLLMGPSLQTWRLTGYHRITPGVMTTTQMR